MVINILLFIVLLVAFWGSICSSAQAQTALEKAATQQSQQIERDQTQRDLQRRLELDAFQREAPNSSLPEARTKPKKADGDKDENCFDIRKIVYEGNSLLEPVEIDALLANYTHRCIGASKINALLKSVTFLYMRKGYIMARAYIPEQDLNSHILKIVIVEGTLQKIVAAKKNGLGGMQLSTAFPGLIGKSLQLRDMEQGIDQLNRVRSNNAKTNMKPGKKAGETIVEILNQKKKKWRLGYNQDNLGSENTGQYKSGVSVGIDDIFNLNDIWSFSYGRNNKNVLFDGSADTHKNDSFSANVSIPYGYWTFSLDGSYSFYDNDVVGNILTIKTRGGSQQYVGTVSRVLHRDKTSKTTLSSSLLFKENQSYVNDVKIETSSRKLTIAKLNLAYTKKAFGAAWSFTGGYQRGLKLFGALDDDSTASTFPKAQFNKFTVSASVMKPFKVGSLSLLYNSSLEGQWSPDLLFGSEQIALGGLYSVRGVKSSIFSGNNGAYFRQEISYKIPVELDVLKNITSEIHPFIAYDFGVIDEEKDQGVEHGTVSGLTLGLKGKRGIFSFEAAYADLLHSSEGSAKDEGVIYLKGSVGF